MKKNTLVYFLLFFIILGIIFKNWLFAPNIIGGDWPFFFQQYINQFSFLPPVWNSAQGYGLGGQSIIYALDSYLYFTAWLFSVLLHIPWRIVYKIFWFGFFLLFSVYSSIFSIKTLFSRSLLWQQLLAAIIYTTNTYVLMVVGGGQMGFALAYAIAPLVLAAFIKLIEEQYAVTTGQKRNILRQSLIVGLFLALQFLFDFRVAYIIVLATILYLLISLIYQSIRLTILRIFNLAFFTIVIPIGITGLLHAFWILPFLFMKFNPVETLGSAYTSLESVKFFSFASFENALGLLHPYWPENIFGKVGFMKPEFLIMPILAFTSLLFLAKKEKREKQIILYFALLGLIDAFLAKGANDPFGSIYLWMFNHFPGFIMFRDPTKFYLLIALSYSILMPFAILSIGESFNSVFKTQPSKVRFKIQKFIHSLVLILFVIVWLFTIREAIMGQLNSTFTLHRVPNEYIQLKNNLVNDTHFSRTLWLPKLQRYGYYDQRHPSVEGSTAFRATTSADMIKNLQQKDAEQKLSYLSIKYVIVPFDSERELFLKDRKYNPEERNMIISQLNKISWLTRDSSFKSLSVFTLKNSKDRFWMKGSRKVTSQKISDTEYILSISPGSAEELIFNESYSPFWIAVNTVSKLDHGKYGDFNSFDVMSSKKVTDITLYYAPFPYFIFGRIISLITLIAVIYFLLRSI